MKTINFSHKAIDDLRQIWRYTYDQWDLRQADHYYHSILDSIENIAKGTHAGQTFEPRKDYYRQRTGSHVIFYKMPDENTLYVVRILHKAMQFSKHL